MTASEADRPPTRVLFICLGNICRSPLAENVFRHLARDRGVEHLFQIDSAGTSAYHVGAPPDRRAAEEARRRGLELVGSSRVVRGDDLRSFDRVIAMDAENLGELRRLAAAIGSERPLHLLREWDPEATERDVPDPYYGGPDGFAAVHDMVERCCAALLDELLEERGE
jgi:protein-tyrosine phosphatase